MDGESFRIIQGDARQIIRTLPGRFRAVITSPPYYGHRHYGTDRHEIGREKTPDEYLNSLVQVFMACKDVLTDDGSLWIVIGDTRRRHEKLRIPHRLAEKLSSEGFVFREDIIWYKKNNISSSSRDNFTQAYEYILFFSKNRQSFANLDAVRVQGNEAISGRNKVPPQQMLQYQPVDVDKKQITRITRMIHGSSPSTPISELPSTSEIARAYGYDPEKFCLTCYRKFKRDRKSVV